MRIISLGLALLSLLLVSPAAGQVKNRLIPFPEWASSYEEDEDVPLELVEIKIAGNPIILSQPFDADEDWLKKMTLRVKNISDKPIAAFSVGGGLLKGMDEELPPYASFQYGIGWSWGKGFDPEKERPEGATFKPGEIVELSYGNVTRLTRRVLAKEGEGAFCKLNFMSPGVQYQDGAIALIPKMRFYGSGRP